MRSTLDRAAAGTVSLHPVREAIVADVLKADITIDPDLIEAVALNVVGDLVRGLNDQQRKTLKRLTARALSEDWDQEELTRRINDLVGLDDRSLNAVEGMRQRLVAAGFKPGDARRQANAYAARLRAARAATIAETEVARVASIARRLTWQQARNQDELHRYAVRVWRTDKTEANCPTCSSLNGRRAAVSRPFMGGIMEPPAHPNCKCRVELMLGDVVLSKGEPRDADNDGWIDEGKPTERPAARVYNYNSMGATWDDHKTQQDAIAHFDALPDDAILYVFHGTTKQDAEFIVRHKLIRSGGRRSSGVEHGKRTDGLYVAPTVRDAGMYLHRGSDDVVVKIKVRKGDLVKSAEYTGQTVGGALMNSSAGAVLPPGSKLLSVEVVE